MCIAVPMQIKNIKGNSAVVEFEGAKKKVRLDIIDQQPEIGDYVIIHAGFAIHRIDEEEAKKTLRYLEEITAETYETFE